ncbi:MAG TPA: Asp-tRNA(Asn)/Glu-tRNA(Gln) amidotransferase subunit GatC [Candidatus Babeliales bacterium]|nr:Asp-tRNA(Asn)/Glu-tRNA(Gln) amidotransferase subunit GatC [Candidatus Babeliales bacterium]
MTDITKEELIKLARISKLDLQESEIIPLMTHVQSILAYAKRVKDIANSGEFDHVQQINVLRADVVIRTDNELILSRAPEREGNFFVVPKIIESK